MGMRWKIRSYTTAEVAKGGTDGWEPFAVVKVVDSLVVYCKKEVFVEDDEKRSSVHNQNWMGNEPDEGAE